MNERYLLIMENYVTRDNSSVKLFVLSFTAVLFWAIVETSPFLSTRRPFFRNLYWAILLGTYLLGLIFMTIKL